MEAVRDSGKQLLYVDNGDGTRRTRAPPFNYDALDLEREEIRILVLQPCSGDRNDPYNYVQCTFDVQPLETADSFLAVTNARGYRLLQEVIEVEQKTLLISSALEKFLRNIRNPDGSVRLWARYVCIDQGNPEEMSRCWTRDFVDKVYEKASSVLDMSVFLKDLLRKSTIERSVDSRYRTWTKEWYGIPETLPLPQVYPIRLGKRPSNENPTDDYEYLPLDAVANEIRVIVVATDPDPEAPLILHLAHCPIVSEVAYYALSYTWGDDSESTEVIVNGQKLRIRKNLEGALRALRSPTNGVAIWADAICINQADTDEKNLQIPRISSIYDRAVGVICYVGELDEHSDAALDLVKHLQVPVVDIDDNQQWNIGRPDRIPPDEIPRKCAALYVFLTSRYFHRAWVLQEVALASSPIVACGKRHDVDFNQLEAAAANLQSMLSRDPELSDQMKTAIPDLKEVSMDQLLFVRKLFYFRHLHIGRNRNGIIMVDIKDSAPGYLEAAVLSRDFEASIPHDKIFALWNVARDKNGLDFNMDYSDAYQNTFAAFAKAWALHSRSLDIIGAAEYIRPAEGHSFYDTAPSWCPDWSQPSRSSSLIRRENFKAHKMSFQDDYDGAIYSADGGVQSTEETQYFHFVGPELHCTGIILDTVLFTANMEDHDDNSVESKIAGVVPSTAEFCTKNNLIAYDDIRQAIIAMLHGDVPASWPKRADNPQCADEGNTIEEYVCIPNRPRLHATQSPHASRHVSMLGSSYSRTEARRVIDTVMRGRKVFISEEGLVGLMPEYVQKASSTPPGTKYRLAILATCSVPVLLCDHPEREGAYRLLGACFVQGWMEGEVLMEQMGCDTPQEFWPALEGADKLVIL